MIPIATFPREIGSCKSYLQVWKKKSMWYFNTLLKKEYIAWKKEVVFERSDKDTLLLWHTPKMIELRITTLAWFPIRWHEFTSVKGNNISRETSCFLIITLVIVAIQKLVNICVWTSPRLVQKPWYSGKYYKILKISHDFHHWFA